MRKNIKTFFLTLTFILLTGLLLAFPKESLAFSLTGLQLWFNRMVPTLLPFMILSGIMIRLNLTEHVVKAVSPFLMPFFKISLNGLYAIVIGFLCGFPMGAKVIADLYEGHKISKKEASFLLAFCNNIGPVYFCSFVLPLLGRRLTLPYLFGMYGIPLLYGLLLRHTVFRDSLQAENASRGRKQQIHLSELHACSSENGALPFGLKLLEALDDSIVSSLQSILTLGGYMVLFDLMNLLPHLLSGRSPFLAAPLLEITGGLSLLGGGLPLYSLLALSFGGLSCMAQTYSCIKGTGLSMGSYVRHKVILTLLNGCFYLCWLLLSPATFLC